MQKPTGALQRVHRMLHEQGPPRRQWTLTSGTAIAFDTSACSYHDQARHLRECCPETRTCCRRVSLPEL